jgi:hypothetical protein
MRFLSDISAENYRNNLSFRNRHVSLYLKSSTPYYQGSGPRFAIFRGWKTPDTSYIIRHTKRLKVPAFRQKTANLCSDKPKKWQQHNQAKRL